MPPLGSATAATGYRELSFALIIESSQSKCNLCIVDSTAAWFTRIGEVNRGSGVTVSTLWCLSLGALVEGHGTAQLANLLVGISVKAWAVVSALLLLNFTKGTNRVFRSTSVPAWEGLPLPLIRSPSQWSRMRRI